MSNAKVVVCQLNHPCCSFFKKFYSREKMKPWFLWLLISMKFHWNLSSCYQKIWRYSPSNVNIFIGSSDFFWHFLVSKKLMMSAYQKWCHQSLFYSKFSYSSTTIRYTHQKWHPSLPFENNGPLQKWYMTNTLPETDKYDTHKTWCLKKWHTLSECPNFIFSMDWGEWFFKRNS